MDDATYGRGQMEWALWRSFTIGSFSAGEEVPKVFLTRIKRLLEIDRDLDLSGAEVPPEALYAFAPPPSDQSGDTAYLPVDAFCLMTALDLLDAGFKQAEVVFLMRYLRPELERRFADLLKPPSLIGRRRSLAKAYPRLPAYTERGKDYADNRLFVVLQKIEMTEIVGGGKQERQRFPLILEPIYCEGIEALKEALHDLMPNRRRAVTVLELAASAQAVAAFLQDAPSIQRGRPKKAN